MSYQVLARKWRPRNFSQLVGQNTVVRALSNALEQNRLHHAYLFTGTRGVGKTTVARILAKCLNCEQGVSANPCGTCISCQEIDSGRFLDLIEVDAASRTKVEDTRELLDNVQYSPTKGRYKIYLIDEVHMLSGHSFNALLKTLEEPPPHVKFLLATTDPQRLPITVLSRCLQLHLKNLLPEQIIKQLCFILEQEQISYELQGLQQLARSANGSMRDALSLLDQAIAYGNGTVNTDDVKMMLGITESGLIIEMVKALLAQDAHALLSITEQLTENAAGFSHILEELLSLFHQLAIIKSVPDFPTDIIDDAETIKSLAQQISEEDLQLYYQIGLIGRRDLALAPTERSGFEMILLRMLKFTPSPKLNTISGQNVKATSYSTANAMVTKPTKTDKAKDALTPSNLETNNWAELLAQLNLRGATLALASHCSPTKFTDNEIILLLDASHEPLLNKTLEQRIMQALQEYLKRPIKLTITVGKATDKETPAIIEKRKQAEQQASAQKTIQDDENVKAIISAFNAKIIPESIKQVEGGS